MLLLTDFALNVQQGILNGKRFVAKVKPCTKIPSLPRTTGSFIPAADYFSSGSPAIATAVSGNHTDAAYAEAVAVDGTTGYAVAEGEDDKYETVYATKPLSAPSDYLHNQAAPVYDNHSIVTASGKDFNPLISETGFNNTGYNPSGVVSVGSAK